MSLMMIQTLIKKIALIILFLLSGEKMFDHTKSDKAIRFFENQLRHTKHPFHNKPFNLLKWQKDIISRLYGSVDINGHRQYRTVYIEIPKKNGKSELAAGVALKQLFASGEHGAEIYIGAGDTNQASIIYEVAENMVLLNKKLRKRSHIKSSRRIILNKRTTSKLQVLSAEKDTKHGLNSSCVIIDELHVVKTGFFEILTEGSGDARLEPIFFYITTAGDNKKTKCWELHNHAKKVLENPNYDPTFLAVIYGLEDTEDWKNKDNWYKANPSLGDIIDIKKVDEHYNKALLLPSQQASFCRLRLNMWGINEFKWMSISFFQKCRNDNLTIEQFRGQDCFISIDLSSTKDLTSVCYCFPDYDRDKFYMFWKYFIPEENIQERIDRDGVPYDQWIREGFIIKTHGCRVDYNYIKKDIFDTVKNNLLNVKEVPYDPWNAQQTAGEMLDEGYVMVLFRQGWATMSPAAKEFERRVAKQDVEYPYNPVSEWCIGNTVVIMDEQENIKPSKDKSTERIDGTITGIMSLYRAHLNQDSGSVYDKEVRG